MKQSFYLLVLLMAVFSCKKEDTTTQEDLCEGVICVNGGTCVNGDCLCPARYTGPDCSQEKPPIKIQISGVRLTEFPATDVGGAGWDVFDGPDVFFTLSRNGTVFYTSSYVEDLTGAFTWIETVQFVAPQATYSIDVYDYDDGFSQDDFMGGISFIPYKSNLNFPQEFQVNCGACVVGFTFIGATYTH